MASGDRPDTSRKPKPSGKKAKRLSQKEQSERFIETARTVAADSSGKAFDDAIDILIAKKGYTSRGS
jgi:hypothetical protein